MHNVAIIGAAGFIGQHLLKKLLNENNVNLCLFGRSEATDLQLPYKKIDFFNNKELQTNFENIEVIYYLVSETIPSSSWDNPKIEIEKNLSPFLNFLEVISKLKVKKRIAFISSAGTVYGATTGKVSESFDKKPFSPYGIMKLTMENFLHYYYVKHQLHYDIYRVSNVYGEGQNINKGLGLINTFLENIIKNNKIKVFGNGESTRNYIYVKDVVELMSLSLQTERKCGVYNISSNTTLNIKEVIEIIKSIVKEDFEVIYEENRESDNSYIDLDNKGILKCFPDFCFTEIKSAIETTYLSLKRK